MNVSAGLFVDAKPLGVTKVCHELNRPYSHYTLMYWAKSKVVFAMDFRMRFKWEIKNISTL